MASFAGVTTPGEANNCAPGSCQLPRPIRTPDACSISAVLWFHPDLVLLLIHFVTKKRGGNLVPNAWQSLVELIYDFVLNLGMIPYSFTVTSHFLITLGLSFSLFIGITIVAFQRTRVALIEQSIWSLKGSQFCKLSAHGNLKSIE
ncbi:ATPase subunit 6 [Tanacetum coccineum]